jgi:FkbM family methyltransferase
MQLIKKIINIFLKIFNLKLIKIIDQFNNSYRLTLAFKEKKIDCIFDIGANEGQFAKEIRFYGYNNEIISFEPLELEFEKLKSNSKNDKNWSVYQRCAVGNNNNEIEINVSKNSVSSSVLKMNKEHYDVSPESKYIEKQIVKQKKIDDIFKELNKIEKNCFLKIDVQGYEEQVLEGAKNVISEFKGLLVEVSLADLYEGQTTWIEMINKIQSLGFKIWSIDRGFTNKKNGKTLQIDLVFFR